MIQLDKWGIIHVAMPKFTVCRSGDTFLYQRSADISKILMCLSAYYSFIRYISSLRKKAMLVNVQKMDMASIN